MTKFGFLNLPRPFVKVISGLANNDLNKVIPVVNAAVEAGIPAVDVAADVEIIRWVKDHTPLCLFVSALEPNLLIDAAHAGADVVELGNFDTLYANGGTISAGTLLGQVREILAGLPVGVRLCVTIPGILSADEQKGLATQLQAMGVHFLQIESLAGKHELAIALAAEIQAIVEIPVILAGGITLENLKGYAGCGVAGLGIGRAISALQSEKAMVETLRAMTVTITEIASGATAISL